MNLLENLPRWLDARRYGPGMRDLSPARQDEVRKAGLFVNADGSCVLPGAPYRTWRLVKLGPVAVRGPRLFVWQHDHYTAARLMPALVSHFWPAYAACRLLGRHPYMLRTFTLTRRDPAENFKCACCAKPARLMAETGDTIAISAPIAASMRAAGLDPDRIARLSQPA